MSATSLKLLLSTILITSVMTTFTVDEDHGECESASPTDSLDVNVTEPKAYDIKFVVKPNFNEFYGICGIALHVHHATRTIRLHAYKIRLSLSDIQLSKVNSTEAVVQPVQYRYCEISQILELHYEKDIFPGVYYLKLSFVAYINDLYKGLIQYRYITKEEFQRSLITNLFQPIVARRVFPCWDEPGIKTSFNISIVHPNGYTVLSNMGELTHKSESNNLNCTKFDLTPLISPSEVAIVMFDNTIRKIETRYNFIYMENGRNIWHLPHKNDELKFAYSMIHEIKTSMSRYTLRRSVTSKTDYIMIPHSPAKATGSFGIVICREEDFTYYEKLHFTGRKLEVWKLLARQETRQWFSGPVTPSLSSDMWITDSFAMFFSHYYTMQHEYSSLLEDLFVVQVLQPTLHNDKALQMKPVVHEVNVSNEIDIILYSRLYPYKGSILLRMLQHILTPRAFRQCVAKYVKGLMERSISPLNENFWKILQDTYDIKSEASFNISDTMDGWLRQRHYPELNVSCDYNTTRIKASCENDTKWHIPISIYTQSNLDSNSISDITWMQCPGINVFPGLPDINFVIVNLQQIGYYRVNYEVTLWQRIASFLLYEDYKAIPMQNRAQLIDDAYYFVMEGKLPLSTFLNLIKYLRRETHYIPWYPMFNILSHMSSYLELPVGRYFKASILENLDSLLKNIGYKEFPGDDEMTKSLRLLAARWACKFGLKECLKAATAQLQAKVTNSTEILPWWKDWVYCMGMKQLHIQGWHALMTGFFKNNETDVFKYLACTDHSILVTYYISVLTKDDNVFKVMDDEKLTEHFRSTLKRHLGKNDVLRYVLQNIESILKRFFGISNATTLWGDIILSLPPTKLQMAGKYLKDVPESMAPERRIFEQLVKARKQEIHSLTNKYFF
ncbi:aminopeptidase N-like isoform X2 [Odontomachus brunneus]|nr:aminopeptidase N-like isoform X2 [Odontomachus brunneus]XP_032687678.1 aminopeptidase N-like isoform X2 [Odontomachus brunneus]